MRTRCHNCLLVVYIVTVLPHRRLTRRCSLYLSSSFVSRWAVHVSHLRSLFLSLSLSLCMYIYIYLSFFFGHENSVLYRRGFHRTLECIGPKKSVYTGEPVYKNRFARADQITKTRIVAGRPQLLLAFPDALDSTRSGYVSREYTRETVLANSKRKQSCTDSSETRKRFVCTRLEEIPATAVPSSAAAFSNIDPDLVGALCRNQPMNAPLAPLLPFSTHVRNTSNELAFVDKTSRFAGPAESKHLRTFSTRSP